MRVGQKSILNYRGVRYAEPLIAAERWRAPIPYNGDLQHAIDNRDSNAKWCPQGTGWDLNRDSEDCLYMNIHTPDGAQNLPIFIFVSMSHR